MKHTLKLFLLLALVALLGRYRTPEPVQQRLNINIPLEGYVQSLNDVMPIAPILPMPPSLSIHGISLGMKLDQIPDTPDDLEVWLNFENRVLRVTGHQLEVDAVTLTRENTWEDLVAVLGQPDPQNLERDACIWAHYHFEYAELNLSGGAFPDNYSGSFTLCNKSQEPGCILSR